MRSSNQQKLSSLLALAWVLAQPGTVNALTFGYQENGQAHGLSLESDSGHLDLVLTHDEGAHAHPVGTLGQPDHESWCPTSEHVVHLTGDPANGESARRHAPAKAPLLAAARPTSFPPVRTLAPDRASGPHVRASEILRTIVLRL